MKHLTPAELEEIALDLEVELGQLARLREDIDRLSHLIAASPELADVFYENQAFKLHNFYTGCERIFRIVASELNGALPTGYDWHKRLLERMAVAHAGRPALISGERSTWLFAVSCGIFTVTSWRLKESLNWSLNRGRSGSGLRLRPAPLSPG